MPNGHISLPQWKMIVGGVTATVIGAILSALLNWGIGVSAKASSHEASIQVLNERSLSVEKRLTTIESTQLRMENKIDQILMGKARR